MSLDSKSVWSDLSQLPVDLLAQVLIADISNLDTQVCWANFRLVCRDWRRVSCKEPTSAPTSVRTASYTEHVVLCLQVP